MEPIRRVLCWRCFARNGDAANWHPFDASITPISMPLPFFSRPLPATTRASRALWRSLCRKVCLPKPLWSHSASSTCNPTCIPHCILRAAMQRRTKSDSPTVDDEGGRGRGKAVAVASLRRTDLAAEKTPEPARRDPGRRWANLEFVRVPGWTIRYGWLSLLASKTARDEVLLYFRLASKDGTQPKSDASCNARPTQRDST